MQKKQILSASDVIASIMISNLRVEIIGEKYRQQSSNMIINWRFQVTNYIVLITIVSCSA